MMRITFLGTSGSAPTKERGLSAVALEYDGQVFMFDCGEGAQRQMMRYGVNYSKVSRIFITHMHADHVIGIAGLARTFALYRRTAPLFIYVPEGSSKQVLALLKFDSALITYPIIVEEITSGKVYADRELEVRAFALNHTVRAYGYALKERDRHHFIKAKCDSFGIRREMFSQLSRKGSIRIGRRIIKLGEVTTPEPGRKVVYATDSRPAAATARAAKGADLLIHEATYDSSLAKLAKERKHSTAEEAARIAKRAGVMRLVVTHLSTRYRDAAVLAKDARKVFRDTDVAEDGMRIEIPRRGAEKQARGRRASAKKGP